MKDLRIDDRLQRVFVLTESDDRLVYIPVKSLMRVDYDRLKRLSGMTSKDRSLMDVMAETRLENGKNALVQYDNLIQVMVKDSGARLRKPEENIFPDVESSKAVEPVQQPVMLQEVVAATTAAVLAATAQQQPQRKKPGPKPRVKSEETADSAE